MAEQSGPELKVVLAVWEHDEGLPHRGHSHEYAHFRPALTALGHQVIDVDLARTRVVGPVALTAELERVVAEHQPDVVVCSLYEDDLDLPALTRLTASGATTTFNWFADDHWRFDGFSSRWAPAFTWVSTTDATSVGRYHAAGIDHVLLTQWAASPRVFAPRGLPLLRDVAFVGQVYGERRATLEALRDEVPGVELFGSGWNLRLRHRVAGRLPVVRSLGGSAWRERVRSSTRLTLPEMVAAFEQTRVNVNLADSSHGTRQQIKGRVFEVPASGGFLLTQDAERLEEFLVPGEEVGVFSTPSDLRREVTRWLGDEDRRLEVARRGTERVRREHTYERRFEALFRGMGLVP